ncbi:MAG: ribosome-associated translation inhibitor RaiA [Clostridiales bacterium]|jgi:putative sigma-54 modulation protein|nr:ribosome-associated translation inhibitor RaiA [Clostridiales bacterium]
MNTTITGRKFELTQDLKAYVEKKFAKLDKFFGDDAEARITMAVEKERQRVEATIHFRGTIFRAEEITSDMYNTIDKTVDAVERQIRKHKTRLEKRLKAGALSSSAFENAEPVEEEKTFDIVKTKLFETKPMSAEEAVLQMNLLGHEFFVFAHDQSGKTSIVYRRKDRNYGLIEVK